MNLKAILLAATAVVAPSLALADEAAAPTVSANIGVATDYVFRGVDQNVSDDPQLFAGLDVGYGMFYAGVWASNVDFGTDAGLEVDIYAGVKPKLGPVQLDLGALVYAYPQETDLNVVEIKAAGTIAAESGLAATGSLFYSPEFGKDGPSYWYGELALSAPISDAKIGPFGFTLTGSIGTLDAETNPTLPDYTN
jgi:uncharacterized protein (TIGR02001 family)